MFVSMKLLAKKIINSNKSIILYKTKCSSSQLFSLSLCLFVITSVCLSVCLCLSPYRSAVYVQELSLLLYKNTTVHNKSAENTIPVDLHLHDTAL